MIGQIVSHYQILQKLGEGGMGVVYLARDTQLGRSVAIKVLAGDLVSHPDRRQRFVQEARTASGLNHPNIITIYEIFTFEGSDYMAMEYVRGQTLGRRIGGRGLRLWEVRKYALPIADALVKAHGAGIVHRDMKPANIMISDDGLVKVLDFGLAKLTGNAETNDRDTSETIAIDQSQMTIEGVILGTASYMSPEQAEGQRIDARSDIFSFGAILYEMLSGRRAFEGASKLATLAAVLRSEPKQLHTLTEEAIPEMAAIVSRCLRKDPDSRYQQMTEVKQALEELDQNSRSATSRQSSGITPQLVRDTTPSIAVLPFMNLSSDKENEYFSDGLAEEIIGALAKIAGLRVAARTSSFAMRERQQDIRDIGDRLNVGALLEGSVRRAGNRIRVTAQLINVADGYHLWSERYDREMVDVFAIQDEISQAIVSVLRVQLTPRSDSSQSPAPLVRRFTDNVEAYNLFLKGRFCLNKFTAEGLSQSKECFEQAIALDPRYAMAYVGMAGFWFLLGFWALVDPGTALPQMRANVEQALAIDQSVPEAHALRGVLYGLVDWNWPAAESEMKQALEINPASVDSRVFHSLYVLRPTGRIHEAIREMQYCLELDPLSTPVHVHLGFLFHQNREFDRGIEFCRKALELEPNYHLAYWWLGLNYSGKRMHDEAIAAFQRGREIESTSPLVLGFFGLTYAVAGRHDEARRVLAELEGIGAQRYVSPFSIALIHLGLGDLDRAFEWTDKAIDIHDPIVLGLKVGPALEELQPEPRYQALLRRVNLL